VVTVASIVQQLANVTTLPARVFSTCTSATTTVTTSNYSFCLTDSVVPSDWVRLSLTQVTTVISDADITGWIHFLKSSDGHANVFPATLQLVSKH